MAKETYIATVQIVIDPRVGVDSQAAACDYLSEFLQGTGILDWQYLKVGGQRLTPAAILVNDHYEEGDAF